MRIVIDMQGAQTESRLRGIGRYTLSLAQAMVRNRGQHEIILALNGLFPDTVEGIRDAFHDLLPQENIRVWQAAGPVHAMDTRNNWRKDAAELIREAFIANLNPDVVHITSLMEGFGDDAVHSIGRAPAHVATAVTFYDVIPLIQSDIYLTPNPQFEPLYRSKLDHLRRADLFLAISESSRQEAMTYLDAPPDNVINISAAADPHFVPLQISVKSASALKQKFSINRRFLMYSGATDDRKNHLGLINAYALLSASLKQQYQLALVGGLPEVHLQRFKMHILAAGLDPADVVITGRVTDEELIQFYNLCSLYIFPSQHEGFGLPALEAMSCGAAVIGSNNTSVPEVIGCEAALFDPYSVPDIARKITHALNDPHFLNSLRAHGPEQAKKFTWDTSAKTVMAALEQLHQNHSGQALDKDRPASLVQTPGVPGWLINAIGDLAPPCDSTGDLLQTAQAIARNHPLLKKKQLLVDVSELVQRDSKTGVQRVVRSILRELLLNPPQGYTVVPVFATLKEAGYRYEKRFTEQFMGRHDGTDSEDPIDYASGDIFLGLDVQHHVVPRQAGFYQDMRRIGVQVNFVLYDLLPLLMPSMFPEPTFADHHKWINTITAADGILCISQSVADELKLWLYTHGPVRVRPINISWFHLGANIEASLPTEGVVQGFATTLNQLRQHPSVLMVGTLEPRKGYAQSLAAFEALWARGVQANLVIVGKPGWNVEWLMESLRQHPQAGQQLFWFDSATDEMLLQLYAAAAGLLMASEGEGFGLPLIEAAQHKRPILARDIPVFHEVAGEHASYFSGNSAAALAEALDKWLKNLASGQVPPSDAMPWLTWEQSAAALKKLIIDNTIVTFNAPANPGSLKP